jgi:hypothetical protein
MCYRRSPNFGKTKDLRGEHRLYQTALVKARKSNYLHLIWRFYHSLLVKPHIPLEDGKAKQMLFYY